MFEAIGRLPGWPLLLEETAAAAFLSLKVSEFRRAVAHCELPPPELVAGQRRWSRLALEARFDATGAAPRPGHDPIAAAIAAAEV